MFHVMFVYIAISRNALKFSGSPVKKKTFLGLDSALFEVVETKRGHTAILWEKTPIS